MNRSAVRGLARVASFRARVALAVPCLAPAVTAFAQNTYVPWEIKTFAGSTTSGSADGNGAAAQFKEPQGIALSNVGNVFVADTANHTVRKITPNGDVVTWAGSPGVSGSANGQGASARFNFPVGLAVDELENVYVADSGNHLIRMIDPNQNVTTIAGTAGQAGSTDGPALGTALFRRPLGVGVAQGGVVFVADTDNHTIRQISGTPRTVITVAGLAGTKGDVDGTGNQARFNTPSALTVNSQGLVFVSDSQNYIFREVTPATKQVRRILGFPGNGGSADWPRPAVASPMGLSVDGGNKIYFADTFSCLIRRYLFTANGQVTTLAGLPIGPGTNPGSSNGLGSQAAFNYPRGIAVNAASNKIYIADSANHMIRVGTPVAPPVITIQPPASITVPVGGTITLSVTAQASVPLSYAWYKDNASVPIAGATAPTFTKTNAQTTDAGSYKVNVFITGASINHPETSVLSSAATVNVTVGSPGGGGGGGGAPSLWFFAALAGAAAARFLLGQRRGPPMA